MSGLSLSPDYRTRLLVSVGDMPDTESTLELILKKLDQILNAIRELIKTLGRKRDEDKD